ncbi:MAG: pantetheine-phosphate adenylyltransferase [Clostridia bacterium]|nr:pantetheine-phosphate adenylyltransferase [Clostridia bacterium]
MGNKRIALYPGSFDPLTVGHLDLIVRAAAMYDRVYVAVMHNAEKRNSFTAQERVRMIGACCGELPNVTVLSSTGLTAHLAKELDAGILLRGLRGAGDIEGELLMARVNARLNPELETVLLPAAQGKEAVSSSLVREIASLGGDISSFVPPQILSDITKRFQGGKKDG